MTKIGFETKRNVLRTTVTNKRVTTIVKGAQYSIQNPMNRIKTI